MPQRRQSAAQDMKAPRKQPRSVERPKVAFVRHRAVGRAGSITGARASSTERAGQQRNIIVARDRDRAHVRDARRDRERLAGDDHVVVGQAVTSALTGLVVDRLDPITALAAPAVCAGIVVAAAVVHVMSTRRSEELIPA